MKSSEVGGLALRLGCGLGHTGARAIKPNQSKQRREERNGRKRAQATQKGLSPC
jgi:hypothetical protein